MSLQIECQQCGHTGKVSPAKAGKTISCPSCSEPIKVSTGKSKGGTTKRANRRPKTDNSLGLVALLGSTVLLGGIVAMYWIKKQQIEEESNLGQSPIVEQPLIDDGTGVSIPASSNDIVNVAVEDSAKNSAAETKVADPSSTDLQTETANSATKSPTSADSEADIILPEVQAVKPQVALLAGITQVVFELHALPEDLRGAVHNAIRSNCTSELTRCRLKCLDEEADNTPTLVVDLDLRDVGGVQHLGMKAQLQADMFGVPVVVWENEAGLMPIDQKTLNSGISVPGLDRQVAKFFVSLRDKISTSKTAVNSIKEINRRKKEAQYAPSLNAEG